MNRFKPSVAAVTVILWLAAGWAAAEGIHITSDRNTGWPWSLTDGAGYRWDVSANGQVNDGTNDCYDGGMLLRISGSQFSWGNAGKLSKDGLEVEVGPWTHGSIQVWRRIYVDNKLGYCRWIDIFENTSNAKQTAPIQYYSNMGCGTNMTYTTSGQADLTGKDWGIITADVAGSSRPAVIHVFATRASKLKPRFQWTRGDDSLYYNVSLDIPAQKTVALCFFEMQRRPYQDAQKVLKALQVETELRKVPVTLRRIILNMGGAVLTLGKLELPRHEKYDLIMLRNENEILGTIINQTYLVEAIFQKIDLPAQRVIGMSVPIEGDHVEVGLVDGQVVCGRLLNAPLRFKEATGGSEMELPPAKIRSASYSMSANRPDEIALASPMLVLRSGERLYFNPDDLDLTFHTRYGDVKLRPDDLKMLYLDTPEGGLHRAAFRNGSVLSGLLNVMDLKLRLQLGPTLQIRRHAVERLIFPGGEGDGESPVEMKLHNDDELYGHIVDKSLTVKTRFGNVVVAPKEITELVFPEASLGRVQIKLHNGTTISGQFVGEAIRFQIGSGPTLPVSVGHVSSITSGKASGEAAPPSPPGPPAPPPPDVRIGPFRRGGIQLRHAAPMPAAEAVTDVAPPVPVKPAPPQPVKPAPATAAKPAPDTAKQIEVKQAELAEELARLKKAAAQNIPASVLEEIGKKAAAMQAELARLQKLLEEEHRQAELAARNEVLHRERQAALAQLELVRKELAGATDAAKTADLKARLAEIEKHVAAIEKTIAEAKQTASPKAPATRPIAPAAGSGATNAIPAPESRPVLRY